LKTRELRALDAVELEQRLGELKETLFNLRFQHATGQLDNPMKIKETRREIARVCTVMTERQYAIHPHAFEEAMAAPLEIPLEESEGPPGSRDLEEPEEVIELEDEAEMLEDELEMEPETEDEEYLEQEVEEELRER
jgi:large subunit ribosomal protein L29